MFTMKNLFSKFKIDFPIHPIVNPLIPSHSISLYLRFFRSEIDSFFESFTGRSGSSVAIPKSLEILEYDDQSAVKVQNLLRQQVGCSSVEELEYSLDQLGLLLSDGLVMNVLHRNCIDWRCAYLFFNWVTKKGESGGYSPGSWIYNKIITILGVVKRFHELSLVVNNMFLKSGVFDERIFSTLVNKYVRGHRIDEAIQIFYRRTQFGLELHMSVFHFLLYTLCRHRHVHVAEHLFHSKKDEFPPNIKTMNIILNGWLILGNWKEVKRVWNEINQSPVKLNQFTYGIYINALVRNGQLGKAIKLFESMWHKGCPPDAAICSCIIHALCLKGMISAAMDVFREMNKESCLLNAATYNVLIKWHCRFRRKHLAYELLGEMEQKGGECTPNPVTYTALLKSARNPKEVGVILDRMEKNGQAWTTSLCNVVLELYVKWDCPDMARSIWMQMVRSGLGPDYWSYDLMIRRLYEKGKTKEAMYYFEVMESKQIQVRTQTMDVVREMKSILEKKEMVEVLAGL